MLKCDFSKWIPTDTSSVRSRIGLEEVRQDHEDYDVTDHQSRNISLGTLHLLRAKKVLQWYMDWYVIVYWTCLVLHNCKNIWIKNRIRKVPNPATGSICNLSLEVTLRSGFQLISWNDIRVRIWFCHIDYHVDYLLFFPCVLSQWEKKYWFWKHKKPNAYWVWVWLC